MSDLKTTAEIFGIGAKGANPEVNPRSHTDSLGSGTPITSLL